MSNTRKHLWSHTHKGNTISIGRCVSQKLQNVSVRHPRRHKAEPVVQIIQTEEGKQIRVRELAPNESFAAEFLRLLVFFMEGQFRRQVTCSAAFTSASRNNLMILTETLCPWTNPLQMSPNAPAATCCPTLCKPVRGKHVGWRPDARESRSRALDSRGLAGDSGNKSRS
jgi:hypothetical protein